MILSIIIPVYNGSRFIEQCFSSIDFNDPEIEVIVVNDGSKDNSKDILEAYREKFQFILVNNDNKGVSHSRNIGLDMASGNYILFLDIDDFVSRDFFDNKDKIFKEDADMVIFDRASIPYSCSTVELLEMKRMIGNSYNDVLNALLTSNILNPCWGFAFKREIIEKYRIRFDETMTIGEDSCFVIDYFKRIRTISFANHMFCINNVNTTSAMHNFIFEKRKLDFVETSRRKIQFALEKQAQTDKVYSYVGWNYRALICDLCGQLSYKTAKEKLFELWEDPFISNCFVQFDHAGIEMALIRTQNTVLCYTFFALKYKLRMLNRLLKVLKNKIQRK